MGYDVYITRAASSWADPPVAARRISKSEWLRYQSGDRQLGGSCDAQSPDSGSLADEGVPVCVLYTGADGSQFPLLWVDGQVNAKDPPPKVIVKLCAIATALHARVQGDEDEYYCEP
jgi:hypothetical protein